MQELRKYEYCRINIALAVIQAAVFVICMIAGDRLYLIGRCGTNLVLEQKQYWRLLTSVFLHSGLTHLGSNLLVQVLMGNAVERNLGHIRNTYSVGASGAVFGVMGALIILIIKGRKKLRAGSSLPARAAFAVFYAVYAGFKNPYTDNAAHIGGLIFGLVLGALLTVPIEDADLRDLR